MEKVTKIEPTRNDHRRFRIGQIFGSFRLIDLYKNNIKDLDEVFFTIEYRDKRKEYGYVKLTPAMKYIRDTLIQERISSGSIDFIQWNNDWNVVFNDGLCISSCSCVMSNEDFNSFRNGIPGINKSHLVSLLRMTQEQLKGTIKKELAILGRKVISNDGYVYSPGTFPVLLVAHMDTVYDCPPTEIVEMNGVLSATGGIGGDDRCGVELIMEIIESGIDAGVLFCEDEEAGGFGACKFLDYCTEDVSMPYNYILEIDRKGNNEAVFYDCKNEAFKQFVTDQFFHEECGSFSDISILAPHLELAAVNVSAGYRNEHCANEELIDLNAMAKLLVEIKKLLKRTDEYKIYGYDDAEINEEFIAEAAYELYKKDWIYEHILPGRQMESLREYYEMSEEDRSAYENYEEYLFENGYGGELYVCFDEFLGSEFQDAGYMEYLLGPKLFEKYLQLSNETT